MLSAGLHYGAGVRRAAKARSTPLPVITVNNYQLHFIATLQHSRSLNCYD
jgi:hypothetical protein